MGGSLSEVKAPVLYFVSIHPHVFHSYFTFGVFHKAMHQHVVHTQVLDLRAFAVDRHGSIDDKPFGGGDGMVMRPEPIAMALEKIRAESSHRPKKVILLSPRGPIFHDRKAQSYAHELMASCDLVFICGRFAGVDQRAIDLYVDEEISLGDYILAGGELAALAVAEAALRYVPGVLGDKDSAVFDSFGVGCGGYLEADSYTRPQVFAGKEVPQVLRSGDHRKIAAFRRLNSLERTRLVRPDLIEKIEKFPQPRSALMGFDKTQWEERWHQPELPRWDLNGPHPLTKDLWHKVTFLVPQFKAQRLLEPACGSGHNGAYLASFFKEVVFLDLVPKAIDTAKALYGHLPQGTFLVDDFFASPLLKPASFDGIFDRAAYCAFPLELRQRYALRAAELLMPGGLFMSIAFAEIHKPAEKLKDPPFAVSFTELYQHFSPHFDLLAMEHRTDGAVDDVIRLELIHIWRRK